MMTKELQGDIVKLFRRYALSVETYIDKAEKEKGVLDNEDINTINDCIRMFAHMATTLWRLNTCSD